MKQTAEQKADMAKLKQDVAQLLLKHGKTRSTKNLRFDILNLKEQKYPSLNFFKVSRGWVGKQKKLVLKPKAKSIVEDMNEKALVEWFKKRKSNVLSSLVTTSQIKTKFKEIFRKKPTEYALMGFKNKYKIKVVFSQKTKNTNSWVFKE